MSRRLEGKKVAATIRQEVAEAVAEMTAAGRVFRLRGHGMPTVGKADERGDLYVTVDVQIPVTLSPQERTHYEALRALAGAKAEPAKA